jgi:DNA-binding IclR family transcriptional regulator
MKTKSEAYPGTQAVRRAVKLLKAFASEMELTLGELCRKAELSKPTVYRLLTALESEGMVERAGGGYRLGPELIALGSRGLAVADVRPRAASVLANLARVTRETASVEALAGSDVLILDEAMGSYVVGSLPSVGTRWPAHATSTGKALLAHLPEDDERLRGPFPRLTPHTITSPLAMRRELARVRERGYAVSTEELELGFMAVGAPVRRADGQVIAALSVGGPRSRITADRLAVIAGHLVDASSRLSESLGFGDPAARPNSARRRRA